MNRRLRIKVTLGHLRDRHSQPKGGYWWNLAREAAGAPGALVHDFRRTAARRYVRQRVNENTAMKLLGMKTRSIFDRYNIVTEEDMATPRPP
jgi:integrase